MVGKRGKLLVILYVVFLIVLFLMCSTELIIRETEREIYQMAVIIEDVRDDNYGNFRKGMDQAAIEYNADVRFITLYEKMDADGQMELLSREQQDGANALIVAPVDEDRVRDALTGKQTIPAVILGTEQPEESAVRTVIIDYKKMGGQLAGQMLKRLPKGGMVLVLSDPECQSIMSRRFLEGAMAVLKDSGCECMTMIREEEQGYERIMEMWKRSAEGPAAILAESPEILTEAAGLLDADPSLANYVQGIYGRGSTLTILNDLDRGLVTGICVTDEFSAGYHSVRMAVQMLEGTASQIPMVMDSYYIEKQDLRNPEYEKMLFPIE